MPEAEILVPDPIEPMVIVETERKDEGASEPVATDLPPPVPDVPSASDAAPAQSEPASSPTEPAPPAASDDTPNKTN
jgi:hypothetical protein